MAAAKTPPPGRDYIISRNYFPIPIVLPTLIFTLFSFYEGI